MGTPVTITSTRGQAMQEYMPPLYLNSRVITAILQAEGDQFDQIQNTFNDILNQFYVTTATWALDKYEAELNITTQPTETDAQRRSTIISKKRGYGTATRNVVKQIAQAYENGTVDVVEDFKAYEVYVIFIDTRGVPSNIDDLKAVLRSVIPSHLDIQYKYRYFTWQELDAKNWTWDQFDAQVFTWDTLEVAS